ncbi:MAG TPA: hypothetical protein VK458_09575 [Myxococcaceae bacterium]|jgi:hypothetical protein|nr:hypothetical protein [Myxococcaceae bacterium]
MKRIACIVEGEGERLAFPWLCNRILFNHLRASEWSVNQEAFRYPRGSLVDGKSPSPRRPCVRREVDRVVRLAQRVGKADAVIALCDADDDCPAVWGPDASAVITAILPGGAVMACREYESWLLWSRPEGERTRAGVTSSPEQLRDAKGAMRHFVQNYRPTAHQLPETQGLDIAHVRARSDSFDKLVRTLATICGVQPPPRPAL